MEIIGVDTGGTFTDFIYKTDEGKWGVYKLLSTPANPAEAVLEGIKKIVRGEKFKVIHGSTVATNAILERKGAYAAFITNSGFEDIIEIGRQNRSRLYDLFYKREEPLVPSELRFGVSSRVNSEGEVVEDIDDEELENIVKKLEDAKAESVAVCFLFSYLNPEHEIKVKSAVERLSLPVSLSHQILAEFREYERASTTIINAYVSPKMKRYLYNIMDELKDNELRIMQSNGGSISAQTASDESVRTILSGPAGGAVGAFEIGKMAGYSRLITFDMGGTSTDVSLIDGRLPLTFESEIGGFPVKVPMIDIHTVGAGGGSIAYLDAGGSLKVGPESAGADPGPICYGKGERITVTDANLYLGRLVPEFFLGGNMRLDRDRLTKYFSLMSKELNMDEIELAEGILTVANTSMERAIRVISVDRGYDPREFVLFSFGGAGGMHATFLAKLLRIPKVFVPKNPGILSAIGMLMADVVKDYSLTVMLKAENTNYTKLNSLFEPLVEKGLEDLKNEGVNKKIRIEKYLDMRYLGQSYEIVVPFEEDYLNLFHSLHQRTYGYADKSKRVEIVNIRVRAIGIPSKPVFETMRCGSSKLKSDAILGYRDVVFDGSFYKTAIIDRDKLACGNVVEGPAVVVEYSSTIVLPFYSKAGVDKYGNLIIDIEGAENEG
ncbi:hydantoinase/oxoprolinase family protein [Hippea maritima]|uniref:5-oxoprolinase (ATP-hydrolyzing) n=1 Tax=Hippea maritima (strain ATCC 700847 / DSM 10411 / MH2) TaxID=760142 RepID=F2LUH4_HIPMA|nr:hydantoinase/oxoprolinase family protein [Hippea maritima]AEA33500.1 5-oxoprolinase (ATP-hydrolyzing) [Hippea maritima DSM 10411]